MISPEIYLLFIGSVLAMQITPGPDTLLVVSNGIHGGQRRALLCAAGFTLAGVVQIPLIVLGVGKIIHESALLYNLLCLTGALYLLYIGYRMIESARPGKVPAALLQEGGSKFYEVIWQGFVNNLLNPKVFIFMLAFIPLFVDPKGDVSLQLLILAVTMKACGLVVNSTYAVVSGTASRILQSRPRVLRYQKVLSGCVVVSLGVTALGLNPIFGWTFVPISLGDHLSISIRAG